MRFVPLAAALVIGLPGQVVASKPIGSDRIVVTRIASQLAGCPRGYVLARLHAGRVVERRNIRPFSAHETGPLCGSSFRWLAVGRFVSVDIVVTASIGEEAQVYRSAGNRFRLVHVFNADSIRTSAKGDFVLRWKPGAAMHVLEVWLWRSGRFQLVRAR